MNHKEAIEAVIDNLNQLVAHATAKITVALERGIPPNKIMATAKSDGERKATQMALDAAIWAQKEFNQHKQPQEESPYDTDRD